MGRINWGDIRDATFPAGDVQPKTVLNGADGKLLVYGTTVPVDGNTTYAKGCKFQDVSRGKWYINNGSNTSCDFDELLESQVTSGTASGTGPSPLIWNGVDILGAITNPTDQFLYWNDFLDEVDVTTGDGWVLTQVDAKGSIAPDVTAEGGVLTVTSATGDSADDGINAQLTNCLFKPADGREIRFEARVKMADATQQYYVGLAGIDTTLIASGVLDDVVNKAGFYHEAASTDDKISSVTARTSADDKTADVADNTDGVWVKLGFVITNLESIKFYVNGVLVETGTTLANIPNAVMCLSLVAQYEGADGVMSVDWVRIHQSGGRNA